MPAGQGSQQQLLLELSESGHITSTFSFLLTVSLPVVTCSRNKNYSSTLKEKDHKPVARVRLTWENR